MCYCSYCCCWFHCYYCPFADALMLMIRSLLIASYPLKFKADSQWFLKLTYHWIAVHSLSLFWWINPLGPLELNLFSTRNRSFAPLWIFLLCGAAHSQVTSWLAKPKPTINILALFAIVISSKTESQLFQMQDRNVCCSRYSGCCFLFCLFSCHLLMVWMALCMLQILMIVCPCWFSDCLNSIFLACASFFFS